MKLASQMIADRMQVKCEGDLKCSKCNGTGVIPGYAHVSEGKCFQCNGKGWILKAKGDTVTYSREFVRQYMQAGFFPEDQSGMNKLECIENSGHATAEHWLIKRCNEYYIGKPVCRASGWYLIPESDFNEFAKHWNKAIKLYLTSRDK